MYRNLESKFEYDMGECYWFRARVGAKRKNCNKTEMCERTPK